MKNITVLACNPNTHEVWRTHELVAISDIRSELNITEEIAKSKLFNATQDDPVKLASVEYWTEK